MPEKSPNELYSIYKTTIWFAVASCALIFFLLLTVFSDYEREWKNWQKKFVEFERSKVEQELKEAQKKVDPKQLEELKGKLKTAQELEKSKAGETAALQKEKAAIDFELIKVTAQYQDAKQHYDSDKFFFEEHRELGNKEAAHDEQKLSGLAPQVAQLKAKQEQLESESDALKTKLLGFDSDVKAVQKEIEQLLIETTRDERKLEQLKASPIKEVLNAPMVDFIHPTLQVQQVVLDELEDDFYFAKAKRVDRCTTCHLAIDRKGFEDAPQPFGTHPRLDLFLGSSAPHPLEKIGCTTCHGGSGQSLSFTWAAHTPRSEEQKKEWQKKYHWHELHKWEAKMLPLEHVEASCAKCHQAAVHVPEAPKLNQGRDLAQKFGCFGCHLVQGFEDRWKIGPDLSNVRSKLDREWIVRWLQNPKVFRPSTKMPRIFHLENEDSGEGKKLSNAAIEGIATYLLKHSETIDLTNPPKTGNPEIGKRLIHELGCLGCHSAVGASANDHGPELSGLGSKVRADWLFTWLKNPKHYAPNTRMPDLRLTDEEAAHITSYLLAERNQSFESTPIPQVEDQSVDQLALNFLSRTMRRAQAEEELKKLGPEEKFELVGQRMIREQGCFGCHTIQGFEAEKRIGTELTKEGEKTLDKFDFGFVDIEHTKQSWLFQKLKHPRSFDHGKVKDYHEKLRMPEFGFTDEEAESLVTFILSLRKEDFPLEMTKQLNLKEKEIEAGRLLVTKFNCQGCHTLDGVEGRARTLFDDLGNAPPILNGEGAKVQGSWLFQFLKEPKAIRPWLHYRMPTFGFSKEDADTLVKYFSQLSKQEISYADEHIHPSSAAISSGRELFTKLKCIQCHQSSEAKGLTASFLAPNLVMAKDRLKPAWVVEWLKDPQEVQTGTMMPTFFSEGTTPVTDVLDGNAERQIEAIRDYLWQFSHEEEESVKAAKKSSAPAASNSQSGTS